jgi:hypothetical protein
MTGGTVDVPAVSPDISDEGMLIVPDASYERTMK